MIARRRISGALILMAALAGWDGARPALAEASGNPSVPASAPAAPSPAPTIPVAAPDPAARLLESDEASEYWTLFIELESGHRITQRFLLTNAGPGRHTAVATGHLVEPGRTPYRYDNGRRRSRWTLSPDRLFFDIAASHLDLHRPTGELRISKKNVEIQLFFDFAADAPATSVPAERLPRGYSVDVLAVGAQTRGTIRGPWMAEAIETRGRTWLVHTWTPRAESETVRRRVELYGVHADHVFYGLRVGPGGEADQSWYGVWPGPGRSEDRSEDLSRALEWALEPRPRWREVPDPASSEASNEATLPERFVASKDGISGQITLSPEWLRFDPLASIPQPFRWFFRRRLRPQEVWADARIDVTLSEKPGTPSLPNAGVRVSEISSNSNRETEDETAKHRSAKGVASITFLNPAGGR